MEKFVRLTAAAAPYGFSNVDTDRIIRIDRCARTPRHELGRWAFEAERYESDGTESKTFIFNQEPFRGSAIIVAGENFGCGSSREAAVWAIAGMGVRCLIAPSYSDIFIGNCYNNGLLPIVLPEKVVDGLLQRLRAAPPARPEAVTLAVDLLQMKVFVPWGESIPFDVEQLRRECLMEGLDPIGVTLKREAAISDYQSRQRLLRPWVWDL